MPSAKSSTALLLVALLASFAGAQMISNSFPAVLGFTDISGTGTAITTAADDSMHPITTTLGNDFFPAGGVSICNNGFAFSNTAAFAGIGYYTNGDIPAGVAVPVGLPAPVGGLNGVVMPFWDDLYPQTGAAATTIYWQEMPGVLIIQWNNDNHFAELTPGAGITFQVQVFDQAAGLCNPKIQYLYSDTTFTGSTYGTVNDNGLSATIGYAKGVNAAAVGNAKWSYLTSSVNPTTVLTITEGVGGPYTLTVTSPGGPGSGTLQLDFTNGFTCFGGTYFLAVTLSPGFPAGWLYGVPIPLDELNNEIAAGFPFFGPLFPSGSYTLGPFAGLPVGLTFSAVGLGIPLGGPSVPTIHTAGISFTIP